jgi:replication fork protection complex subunit Csm3/Swi3
MKGNVKRKVSRRSAEESGRCSVTRSGDKVRAVSAGVAGCGEHRVFLDACVLSTKSPRYIDEYTGAMPSAAPYNARAGSASPAPDYDAEVEAFLADLPAPPTTTTAHPASPPNDVDAEIKIRKARKPVLKLDENLLLGPAGITKLRSHARKLKFKGKGHEFSDVGRLLACYQLWLDDMYPKAKVRDGLAMVEKVGHSRRMGVVRREWMDACKPKRQDEEVERVGGDAVEMSGALRMEDELDARMAGTGTATPAKQAQPSTRSMVEDDEDELDALIAEHENDARHPLEQPNRPQRTSRDEDEDELDALIAEHEATATVATTTKQTQRTNMPFEDDQPSDEDELDALLAAESANTAKDSRLGNTREDQDDDFADEEEVMAGMGW